MKKVVSFLCITVLFLPTVIWGKIIPLKTFSQLENKINGFNTEKYPAKDILILFDMDVTLTESDDPVFSGENLKRYEPFFLALLKNKTPEQKDRMANLASLMLPSHLMEKNIPSVIKKLQSEHYPTLVLTASMVGRVGQVARREEQRYQSLKSYGIDFSHTLDKEEIILDQIPCYMGRKPLIYKGIILTTGVAFDEPRTKTHSKGLVLKAALDKAGLTPKMIIMVDDGKHNLVNVEQMLQKRFPHVAFLGLHYKAPMTHPIVSEGRFNTFWQTVADESLTPFKASAQASVSNDEKLVF